MGASGGHFQRNTANGIAFTKDSKDENGVIQRIFNALQQEKIIAIKVEVLALDSTSCKLHPDAHGALKNTDNNVSGNQRADGIPSFTWYPQMTRSLSKCTYPVETVTTPHKEESQSKT